MKNQFERIYREEADNIFRFVLLRITGREEALDITEEVFYKFWQTLQAGEKIENVKAFLFTLTRNKVIDWYRKKKPESLDNLMGWNRNDDEEGPFQIEDTRQNILASSEAGQVMDTISSLPDQYREVVRMRFVDGLPIFEIAKILGTSENAISLRLNRALQKLREKLGINIENE